MCKIKVLYFLKTNTYEIDFGNHFEGFSKAKIAFGGVRRARQRRKMRSEMSFNTSMLDFRSTSSPPFHEFWVRGGSRGGLGGGLEFIPRI